MRLRRLAQIGVSALLLAAAAEATDISPATATVMDPVSKLVADARSRMQVEPAAAERLAHDAETRELGRPVAQRDALMLATAQWLRGEALVRLNRIDEAAPLIDGALRLTAATHPNFKLHGDLLMSRGRISINRGNAHSALVDYQAAFAIFSKTRDPRSQAVALQNIGSIYVAAGDSNRVFYYYQLAEETFPSDRFLTLSSNNNQAIALSDLHRYREAEAKLDKALGIARQLGSVALQVRILDNIADAQINDGRLDAAKRTLQRGLALAQGDAEDWRSVLLGTSARLALRQGRMKEASELIKSAVATDNSEIDTQAYQGLNKTAYQVFKKTGDSREALKHFEIYTALDAEGRSLASSTNSSLLAAKFDFANQNVSIANLKAEKLEAAVALVRLQARQNAIVLGGLLALVVLIAAALIVYLRILQRSRNAIRAANEELSKVNVELEAALLVKSQFLATTSHEIRTPLNAVLGMTQILLADRGLTDDVRERISMVHGAGETMRMLVDDILEFAKIDAGNLEVFCAEMDFHQLMVELVRFWQEAVATKGLAMTLDLGDTPQNIVCDVRRLRQILFNLLSNATKFTLAGNIAVKAEVVTIDGAEQLAIAVADSGIGIPSTAFDSIFEKFNQLDSSTTRQFGGTGLGLAISRSLAGALGGGIGVASVLGKGSTFTLRLPLVRGAVPVAVVPGHAANSDAGGLADAALVLVGGNPIAHSVLRNLLAPRVASFTLARDFAEAASLQQAQSIDIVLVEGADFEADGIDALTANLREVASHGTRIGVIWPRDDAAALSALRASGADFVLTKPIRGNVLRDALVHLFEAPEKTGGAFEIAVRSGAIVR